MRDYIPNIVKARIVADHNNGMSRSDLLIKYNLKHHSNITHILKRYGRAPVAPSPVLGLRRYSSIPQSGFGKEESIAEEDPEVDGVEDEEEEELEDVAAEYKAAKKRRDNEDHDEFDVQCIPPHAIKLLKLAKLNDGHRRYIVQHCSDTMTEALIQCAILLAKRKIVISRHEKEMIRPFWDEIDEIVRIGGLNMPYSWKRECIALKSEFLPLIIMLNLGEEPPQPPIKGSVRSRKWNPQEEDE
jgi:hypothetical protein